MWGQIGFLSLDGDCAGGGNDCGDFGDSGGDGGGGGGGDGGLGILSLPPSFFLVVSWILSFIDTIEALPPLTCCDAANFECR